MGKGSICPFTRRAAPPASTSARRCPRAPSSCSSPAHATSCRRASRCVCRRGFEAQLRPRSGLALEHGVTILNAPGTIDSDYRGEVKAILVNLGPRPFEILRGMRIAQLVVAPVARVELVEIAELAETPRGAGGFGSTGLAEDSTP